MTLPHFVVAAAPAVAAATRPAGLQAWAGPALLGLMLMLGLLGATHAGAQPSTPAEPASTVAPTAPAVAPAEEKNSFGGPKLDVPSTAAKLSLTFEDTESFGEGKQIAPKMQCGRNGGEKPTSPRTRVEGVPAGTASLVVYVLNEPPSWDNHGLFRVLPGDNQDLSTGKWTVPPVANNLAPEKFPKRARLYAGGNSWGKMYSAPCPSAGSWRYTVQVFALDASDKVLGHGKLGMGFAP